MGTFKLIGADDGGTDHAPADGYQILFRFKAAATGNMTEFKIKGYGNGSIKYAIYSDDGGSPPAPVNRLAQQATAQSVVDGWNTFAISAVPIVKDSYYWLAWVSVSGDEWYSATSGVYRKHKAATPNFADPFDNTGFTDYDLVQNYIAGWGIKVLSPSSIATAQAFGTDKVNRNVKPSGLATLEAIGSHVLSVSGTPKTLIPSGITTAETIGTAKFLFHLLPSGIVTLQGLGSPKLNYRLAITGIASGGTFGTLIIRILLQPTVRFIGSEDVSVDGSAENDYFRLSKFTALFSEDISQIRIYSQGNINAKIAIYADNAGEPGALMNALNTAQAIVAGWNNIAFPATAILQGMDYWLAFNSG